MDKRSLINFYKRSFTIFFILLPVLILLETLFLRDIINIFRILIHTGLVIFIIIIVEIIRHQIILKKEMKENANKYEKKD